MDNTHIELQILQLTQLQNLCNQIKEVDSLKQNDDELVKVLKKGYKLTAEEIEAITSLVAGKKKGKTADVGELEALKKKFDSYCNVCEINPYKKDGEFLGYTNVSNKCSNKKSILSKKITKS